MEIRNCIQCGGLFNFIGKPLCPDCQSQDEKDFRTVYNYLMDHKGAGIEETSQAIGINEKKILRFLRERRLDKVVAAEGWLNCSRCGKQIWEGSTCEECTKKMIREIQQQLASSPGPRTGQRMHTAESIKD